MAEGKIKSISVVQTGTLLNETYGTMTFVYNPSIKLCIVSWNGNGTTPPASAVGRLPSEIVPMVRTTSPILTGNYIEAATTGAVTVSTGGKTWTAGYVAFLTE